MAPIARLRSYAVLRARAAGGAEAPSWRASWSGGTPPTAYCQTRVCAMGGAAWSGELPPTAGIGTAWSRGLSPTAGTQAARVRRKVLAGTRGQQQAKLWLPPVVSGAYWEGEAEKRVGKLVCKTAARQAARASGIHSTSCLQDVCIHIPDSYWASRPSDPGDIH